MEILEWLMEEIEKAEIEKAELNEAFAALVPEDVEIDLLRLMGIE